MSSWRFATYGEAMLRYAPANGEDLQNYKEPSGMNMVRTVGGDELNVTIALSKIGWKEVSWLSVLPAGPLGDVVRDCALHAGVSLDFCLTDGVDIGEYTVLPAEGKVHYQRGNSAFAKQKPGLFDTHWSTSLGTSGTWLHLTGITPMICDAAATGFATGLAKASELGLPISIDFNHRPQLGTIEKLWNEIMAAQMQRVHLLILSMASVHQIAVLVGVEQTATDSPHAGVAAMVGDGVTDSVLPTLKALHAKLAGPALACCLKERDARGVQKRWSILIDGTGLHSTEDTPTFHSPKDECGGGSAWAAGIIDGLSSKLTSGSSFQRIGDHVVLGEKPVTAMRRADLLAALCQETFGDQSIVTRALLTDREQLYDCKPAHINELQRVEAISPLASLDRSSAWARVQQTLGVLERAKVVGILRAKNEQKAIERARELAALGFKAIEVTTDSAGFAEGRLLPAVCGVVGASCVVGVGTVTKMEQIELAFAGGAMFALSPVRPTHGWGERGFVGECHRRGILAMPAAFTPQEIYECVEVYGALMVKIFPAQLWSPSSLHDLRRIGDFGKYRLCPSGGVDPSNVSAWLAAGAYGCGMGAKLVGKDVATAPTDTEALKAAEADWLANGRPAAQALAKQLFQ